MTNKIQWTNVLSTCPSLEGALTEISDRVKESIDVTPNLGIIFVSSAYASEYPRVIPLLLEKLPMSVVIGCGGGGIVGMESNSRVVEVEGNIAISLTAAYLPDVEIDSFHISQDLPDLDSPPESWIKLIDVPPQKKPQFILLSDPFTSKINDLLEGLDFAYSGSVKIGGLASSGQTPGSSALFYYSQNRPGNALYREGTIGIALSGNIVLETIVAQGCRPIGPVYQIAKGDRNIILELTDENQKTLPPLTMLRELVQTLDENDRQLAQHSLFIGMASDVFKQKLQQGDFLIRNILGVDPKLGAIAIGDRIRPGQRIQFHLRDATASAQDLSMLLSAYQENQFNAPAGALMFSCLGRGEGLYQKPNFDSELFRSYLENIPLGGFFCSGEIGPVAGKTFLHGYTSAFGIIRQLH